MLNIRIFPNTEETKLLLYDLINDNPVSMMIFYFFVVVFFLKKKKNELSYKLEIFADVGFLRLLYSIFIIIIIIQMIHHKMVSENLRIFIILA